MKNITLSLVLVLFVSACSPKTDSPSVPVVSPTEAAAQKSAEQWLALVDAANYAESWKTAASYFQSAVSQAQWEQSMIAVRQPLGALVSRKLKGAQSTKTAPGAPDGEYVIVQFDTSFANKKEAVETVTPMLAPDGQWKVSGYYIK